MREVPYCENPDCRDGKHGACDGRALDETVDEITICMCKCHGPEGPPKNRAERRARARQK